MKLTDNERELVLAMCRNDLNVTAVANERHYHHNTIRYHVKRLVKKTGYDCSTFYGAFHLLLIILWEDKQIHV